MNHVRYLESICACGEAVEFATGFNSLQEAWESCNRGDWMLWLLAKTCNENVQQYKKVVWIACQCARLSLKYIPSGDDSPLVAIETAEALAMDDAHIDEVQKAIASIYEYGIDDCDEDASNTESFFVDDSVPAAIGAAINAATTAVIYASRVSFADSNVVSRGLVLTYAEAFSDAAADTITDASAAYAAATADAVTTDANNTRIKAYIEADAADAEYAKADYNGADYASDAAYAAAFAHCSAADAYSVYAKDRASAYSTAKTYALNECANFVRNEVGNIYEWINGEVALRE